MIPETASAPAPPQRLRCEYLVDPVGIDERKPRLSWEVSDPRRGAVQSAYQVLVASSEEALERDEADVWDSGKVDSNRSVHVEYEGPALESRRRYYWKVRTWDAAGDSSPWGDGALWEMGLLDQAEWQAKWIANAETKDANPRPCGHFRKTFAAAREVRRARVYASARGIYDLYLNGERVGDMLFRPGWTDYNYRIQYDTYDVTDLLAAGDNCIGAVLGDGWYCGHIGLAGPRRYGKHPSLLAQIEIDYADGSRETIVTDDSWRVATGPLVESDLIMGETYDARLEVGGWSSADFDDADWAAPEVEELGDVPLVAPPGPPVRPIQEIKPIAITEPEAHTYVYDMGQNMVGRVRLRVSGISGAEVRLRFAEVLDENGMVYTEPLRKARATDRYILRGQGTETYEPTFTFHGFRYVEVTGYTGKPGLDAIAGVVVHSDTPPTGTFECSNKMLNQLQSNITWGQKGNFLEVPTDCPQRDERLGWTGDAQVFARTACFNMDVAAFFKKWIIDLDDSQDDEGMFPSVAPKVIQMPGYAAWGDAGVIVPWTVYQCYGDTRLLERHYDAMAGWITYQKTTSDHLIRPAGGVNVPGDWLAVGCGSGENKRGPTPVDLIGTAYFAYTTDLMARTARALGRDADAADYDRLREEIKAVFCREYVAADGRIKGDTQTAYLLALRFCLLDDEVQRAGAVRYLVDDIHACDDHLSTGFVGVNILLPALADAGQLDLAYTLLTNDTYPSWGYSISQGATTIWERWDGWTEEKGFQDPEMNSFNHYAYGSAGEWMYAAVAGIDLDPEEPGYKHLIIRPRPGGGITHARAELQTMYGRAVSSWRLAGKTFTLHVEIPANTRATVHIPTDAVDAVTESGKPLAEARGISDVEAADGAVVCTVGAGVYAFTARTDGA